MKFTILNMLVISIMVDNVKNQLVRPLIPQPAIAFHTCHVQRIPVFIPVPVRSRSALRHFSKTIVTRNRSFDQAPKMTSQIANEQPKLERETPSKVAVLERETPSKVAVLEGAKPERNLSQSVEKDEQESDDNTNDMVHVSPKTIEDRSVQVTDPFENYEISDVNEEDFFDEGIEKTHKDERVTRGDNANNGVIIRNESSEMLILHERKEYTGNTSNNTEIENEEMNKLDDTQPSETLPRAHAKMVNILRNSRSNGFLDNEKVNISLQKLSKTDREFKSADIVYDDITSASGYDERQKNVRNEISTDTPAVAVVTTDEDDNDNESSEDEIVKMRSENEGSNTSIGDQDNKNADESDTQAALDLNDDDKDEDDDENNDQTPFESDTDHNVRDLSESNEDENYKTPFDRGNTEQIPFVGEDDDDDDDDDDEINVDHVIDVNSKKGQFATHDVEKSNKDQSNDNEEDDHTPFDSDTDHNDRDLSESDEEENNKTPFDIDRDNTDQIPFVGEDEDDDDDENVVNHVIVSSRDVNNKRQFATHDVEKSNKDQSNNNEEDDHTPFDSDTDHNDRDFSESEKDETPFDSDRDNTEQIPFVDDKEDNDKDDNDQTPFANIEEENDQTHSDSYENETDQTDIESDADDDDQIPFDSDDDNVKTLPDNSEGDNDNVTSLSGDNDNVRITLNSDKTRDKIEDNLSGEDEEDDSQFNDEEDISRNGSNDKINDKNDDEKTSTLDNDTTLTDASHREDNEDEKTKASTQDLKMKGFNNKITPDVDKDFYNQMISNWISTNFKVSDPERKNKPKNFSNSDNDGEYQELGVNEKKEEDSSNGRDEFYEILKQFNRKIAENLKEEQNGDTSRRVESEDINDDFGDKKDEFEKSASNLRNDAIHMDRESENLNDNLKNNIKDLIVSDLDGQIGTENLDDLANREEEDMHNLNDRDSFHVNSKTGKDKNSIEKLDNLSNGEEEDMHNLNGRNPSEVYANFANEVGKNGGSFDKSQDLEDKNSAEKVYDLANREEEEMNILNVRNSSDVYSKFANEVGKNRADKSNNERFKSEDIGEKEKNDISDLANKNEERGKEGEFADEDDNIESRNNNDQVVKDKNTEGNNVKDVMEWGRGDQSNAEQENKRESLTGENSTAKKNKINGPAHPDNSGLAELDRDNGDGAYEREDLIDEIDIKDFHGDGQDIEYQGGKLDDKQHGEEIYDLDDYGLQGESDNDAEDVFTDKAGRKMGFANDKPMLYEKPIINILGLKQLSSNANKFENNESYNGDETVNDFVLPGEKNSEGKEKFILPKINVLGIRVNPTEQRAHKSKVSVPIKSVAIDSGSRKFINILQTRENNKIHRKQNSISVTASGSTTKNGNQNQAKNNAILTNINDKEPSYFEANQNQESTMPFQMTRKQFEKFLKSFEILKRQLSEPPESSIAEKQNDHIDINYVDNDSDLNMNSYSNGEGFEYEISYGQQNLDTKINNVNFANTKELKSRKSSFFKPSNGMVNIIPSGPQTPNAYNKVKLMPIKMNAEFKGENMKIPVNILRQKDYKHDLPVSPLSDPVSLFKSIPYASSLLDNTYLNNGNQYIARNIVNGHTSPLVERPSRVRSFSNPNSSVVNGLNQLLPIIKANTARRIALHSG